MKALALILTFFFSWYQAQYVIDDIDITENALENGKSVNLFTLNSNVEFYRLKCEKPQYAQFPKGIESFLKRFGEQLKKHIDHEMYTVNGSFFIKITINKHGNVSSINLAPNVPHTDLLRKDIEQVIHKIKTLWIPANCNNSPVESNMRLKIEFSNLSFEL